MTEDTKRPKRIRYTSPKGTFVFPKLNTPDTKFNAKGVYSVKLKLKKGEPETDRIVKLIEDAAQASLAASMKEYAGKKDAKGRAIVVAGPDSPVAPDMDKATGEETDSILILVKSNASFTGKDGKEVSLKPKLYDAKGNETEVEVWGGTEGKVSFEIVPYYMKSTNRAGVSLRLSAVQILKLRSKGSDGNAAMYGFKAEDGYEAMPEMGDEVPAPVTMEGANDGRGQF